MAIDWDSALEYQTIKIVVIRDKRLGIIHYGVMFLILIYVIVYTVVIEGGYLRTEAPFGSARATLQAPPAGLPNQNDIYYCSQAAPSVTMSDGNVYNNSQCIFLDGFDLEYPSGIRGYNFGTTRVKDIIYTVDPSCNVLPLNSSCVTYNITQTIRAYVGGIENYTLYLEHIAYGAITGVMKKNSECKGTLLNSAGKPIQNIGAGSPGDIFSVTTLLSAANVPNLDVRSQLEGDVAPIRVDGAVLVIVIEYTNNIGSPNVYTYTYRVVYIPGLDVAAFEPSNVYSANQRRQRTRHGIAFIYLITGKIGKFDFATLLQTLISGAVLTNVSTVIVDLLLTYVLPQKKNYRPRKYEAADDEDDEGKPNPMFNNKSDAQYSIKE